MPLLPHLARSPVVLPPFVLLFLAAILLGLAGCRENERSARKPTEPAPPQLAVAPTPTGYTRLPFDSATAALEAVLARTRARVLAFGEVHAPRGARAPSATEHFRQELLPSLAPRAAALVVEAWQPAGCDAKVEAAVAQANREIVQQQSERNPNEYLALAQAAKALGVLPLPLRPTCEESARVQGAGAADIDVLLQTVRLVAERTLDEAVRRSKPEAGTAKLVLFYGGALHNDLEPAPERARWSFGPALDRTTDGGFVEVDLVVPEFIGETDTWKSLPWRSAYDAARDGSRVQLLTRNGKSFVLVLAATPKPD